MSERLNDMLDRYGEVCPQKKAAQILSVTPRTMARMMDDGRLRRVGMHVDVRSICDYIENPKQMDFTARMRTKQQTTMIRPGEFYAASRAVKAAKELERHGVFGRLTQNPNQEVSV